MPYFVFFCCLFICYNEKFRSFKPWWINYLGWVRETKFVCTSLLVIMWFLFGEVSFSSGCLGWATLFYCGTP